MSNDSIVVFFSSTCAKCGFLSKVFLRGFQRPSSLSLQVRQFIPLSNRSPTVFGSSRIILLSIIATYCRPLARDGEGKAEGLAELLEYHQSPPSKMKATSVDYGWREAAAENSDLGELEDF